ncbi:MAG: hypothetical protein N2442_10350 [Spirochaetes bacterium]|nr:hypothetical protein [Spirochaetota bacterium]
MRSMLNLQGSMPLRETVVLFSILILFPCCGGCSFQWEEQDDANTFTFLSYNVHNLFDDQDDGTEYPEYSVAKGTWSRTQYLKKLENLSKVIRESSPGGADFLAIYEIEHERILKELIELYLPRMGYREYTVVKFSNSPMGLGFITRLPVLSCKTHQPVSRGFPQRPILEVEVDCGGASLLVFLCHFKSKTEGAEATERNRVASAELIRNRMETLLKQNPSQEILVLGDLNENIDEYNQVEGKYPTALIPLEAASSETISMVVSRDPTISALDEYPYVLYSPWFAEGTGKGSYWYRGNWETIDHVLLSAQLLVPPRLVFSRFRVVTLAYLLHLDGQPNPTYSDHLPLWVELRMGQN